MAVKCFRKRSIIHNFLKCCCYPILPVMFTYLPRISVSSCFWKPFKSIFPFGFGSLQGWILLKFIKRCLNLNFSPMHNVMEPINIFLYILILRHIKVNATYPDICQILFLCKKRFVGPTTMHKTDENEKNKQN